MILTILKSLIEHGLDPMVAISHGQGVRYILLISTLVVVLQLAKNSVCRHDITKPVEEIASIMTDCDWRSI